jgi:hypothetical protein
MIDLTLEIHIADEEVTEWLDRQTIERYVVRPPRNPNPANGEKVAAESQSNK